MKQVTTRYHNNGCEMQAFFAGPPATRIRAQLSEHSRRPTRNRPISPLRLFSPHRKAALFQREGYRPTAERLPSSDYTKTEQMCSKGVTQNNTAELLLFQQRTGTWEDQTPSRPRPKSLHSYSSWQPTKHWAPGALKPKVVSLIGPTGEGWGRAPISIHTRPWDNPRPCIYMRGADQHQHDSNPGPHDTELLEQTAVGSNSTATPQHTQDM